MCTLFAPLRIGTVFDLLGSMRVVVWCLASSAPYRLDEFVPLCVPSNSDLMRFCLRVLVTEILSFCSFARILLGANKDTGVCVGLWCGEGNKGVEER